MLAATNCTSQAADWKYFSKRPLEKINETLKENKKRIKSLIKITEGFPAFLISPPSTSPHNPELLPFQPPTPSSPFRSVATESASCYSK